MSERLTDTACETLAWDDAFSVLRLTGSYMATKWRDRAALRVAKVELTGGERLTAVTFEPYTFVSETTAPA